MTGGTEEVGLRSWQSRKLSESTAFRADREANEKPCRRPSGRFGRPRSVTALFYCETAPAKESDLHAANMSKHFLHLQQDSSQTPLARCKMFKLRWANVISTVAWNLYFSHARAQSWIWWEEWAVDSMMMRAPESAKPGNGLYFSHKVFSVCQEHFK